MTDEPRGGGTLWHGRFEDAPSSELLAFSESLHFDRRLAEDDLAGSRAHVRGLVRAGIVRSNEADAILGALDKVAVELADGTFTFEPTDEDIHTAIERRVTELAGPTGAKLHTGRSRNDQVATALRLYTKRSITDVAGQVLALQRVLLDRAAEAGPTYLPGYTHMQRAQPVLLAHHLLAHGWALARDVDRLLATRSRLDVSPLGAGALAGSSLPLDPDGVADDLGFARRFENSLDAVSDRDFVAETLFDLSLLGVHLSRMGEEIALWSSEEFGFLVLADAYATGSSMLPQKKNPDIAELVRGKAGRLIGHLTGLLATLKGLPLAYNRDLQEDKEPLFDAVDTVRLALPALTGLLRTSTFVADRMQASADVPTSAATDLAELLVERGMPFREAHALVGGLVRDSIERRVPLAELVASHPDLGDDALELLEPGVAVTRRTTPGGAGPEAVAIQIDRFRSQVEALDARASLGDPAAAPVTFRHEIRIRYGEVDMQGVVFNAHYLAYVDDCVDSWLRSIDAHFEQFGWDIMVKKATVEWAGGAALGDVLTLVPRVSRWGNTSFDVTIEGCIGERPVFEATVVYVGVATGTLDPAPVPDEIRAALST